MTLIGLIVIMATLFILSIVTAKAVKVLTVKIIIKLLASTNCFYYCGVDGMHRACPLSFLSSINTTNLSMDRLAYQVREVNIPHLNDSRYIGMSIWNTTIFAIIIAAVGSLRYISTPTPLTHVMFCN
jgi:hypothetical protein